MPADLHRQATPKRLPTVNSKMKFQLKTTVSPKTPKGRFPKPHALRPKALNPVEAEASKPCTKLSVSRTSFQCGSAVEVGSGRGDYEQAVRLTTREPV